MKAFGKFGILNWLMRLCFVCWYSNSASAVLDSSGVSVRFAYNHETVPPPGDSLTAKLLLASPAQ
jgi:hypothetical protein